MSTQPAAVCPICDHPLRFMGVSLARVRGVAYHAACWVFRGAPSAAAGSLSGACVN